MWTLIQAWQFWAALKSCRSAAMANVASIRFGSAMPDHKNHNASHASDASLHFHASMLQQSSALPCAPCASHFLKFCFRFKVLLSPVAKDWPTIFHDLTLSACEEAFRAFSPMTRLEHFVSRLFICLVYCSSKSPEHQLSVVQDAKSIWFGSTDSHVTMFHFDAFCTDRLRRLSSLEQDPKGAALSWINSGARNVFDRWIFAMTFCYPFF